MIGECFISGTIFKRIFRIWEARVDVKLWTIFFWRGARGVTIHQCFVYRLRNVCLDPYFKNLWNLLEQISDWFLLVEKHNCMPQKGRKKFTQTVTVGKVTIPNCTRWRNFTKIKLYGTLKGNKGMLWIPEKSGKRNLIGVLMNCKTHVIKVWIIKKRLEEFHPLCLDRQSFWVLTSPCCEYWSQQEWQFWQKKIQR